MTRQYTHKMLEELYDGCISKPTAEFSKIVKKADANDINDAIVNLCDAIVDYDDVMMEMYTPPGRKYPVWFFDNLRLLIDKTIINFEVVRATITQLENTDRERADGPVNKILTAALNN